MTPTLAQARATIDEFWLGLFKTGRWQIVTMIAFTALLSDTLSLSSAHALIVLGLFLVTTGCVYVGMTYNDRPVVFLATKWTAVVACYVFGILMPIVVGDFIGDLLRLPVR